jgi:hypothetical protein
LQHPFELNSNAKSDTMNRIALRPIKIFQLPTEASQGFETEKLLPIFPRLNSILEFIMEAQHA